jgi:CheY-like chemotaxis protein
MATALILNPVNAQPEQQPHRPTVLVVEDEILIRSAVAEYLRGAAYRVIEAANAAEAITVFTAGLPIDVVFSDVQIPGAMDGLGLARWLRRRHPGVRVMLTSGAGNAGGDERGAELFVPKPYQAAEVGVRIGGLLAESSPPTQSSRTRRSRPAADPQEPQQDQEPERSGEDDYPNRRRQ